MERSTTKRKTNKAGRLGDFISTCQLTGCKKLMMLRQRIDEMCWEGWWRNSTDETHTPLLTYQPPRRHLGSHHHKYGAPERNQRVARNRDLRHREMKPKFWWDPSSLENPTLVFNSWVLNIPGAAIQDNRLTFSLVGAFEPSHYQQPRLAVLPKTKQQPLRDASRRYEFCVLLRPRNSTPLICFH